MKGDCIENCYYNQQPGKQIEKYRQFIENMNGRVLLFLRFNKDNFQYLWKLINYFIIETYNLSSFPTST